MTKFRKENHSPIIFLTAHYRPMIGYFIKLDANFLEIDNNNRNRKLHKNVKSRLYICNLKV